MLNLIPLNIKLITVAVLVAALGAFFTIQKTRIEQLRADLKEANARLVGYQAAVEVQAMAAKADAARFDTMATEARSRATRVLTTGRREKQATVVPGTGYEVMNKWLTGTFQKSEQQSPP